MIMVNEPVVNGLPIHAERLYLSDRLAIFLHHKQAGKSMMNLIFIPNPYSVILKNDKPGENCIGNASA